jgi:uncharacterized protein YbaP (TraB family)
VKRSIDPRALWRRVAAASIATTLLAMSPEAAAAAGRDFLWKVTGKQGVVYLAGSIHMMPESFYPLQPAFESAFKEADLLVEEIDLGEATSPIAGFTLLSRSMLPMGQSLENVLSPATYASVKRHLADLGTPIESVRQLKPWMLAVTFEALEFQKAGYDQNFGLDQHFYQRAQADGKAVQGFETAEFQLSLFDGMPMAQQDAMLADTIKELDTEVGNVSKIGSAWQNGDASALERIIMPDMRQDPAMYKKVLVDRNHNWMPKIDELLTRRGHAFIVVGAAHLLGPDGLLALLQAKGYLVEQL